MKNVNMKNVKLIVGILTLGFMSVSFILPILADENYCLSQTGVKQGYCEEQFLLGGNEESGEDITINWCVGADMSAPNPSGKTECAGNAMEPYQQ